MRDASGAHDHLRAEIQHIRDVIAGKVTKYQTWPPLDGIINDLVRASSSDVHRPLVVADQLPPDMLAHLLRLLIR